MNLKSHRCSCVLRPGKGWALLLLYVAMYSPLGIGLATLLGKLDRDHCVELQTGAGEVRVVLHHQFNGHPHHHGLLAQTLTAFSTSSPSAQADHVLPFQTTPNLSTEARNEPVLELGEDLRMPMIAASETLANRDPLLQPAAFHLPPAESGVRISLRSTVLLI